MTILTQASQTVQSSLDHVTSNPDSGIQGLVFIAVDKNGQTLVEHASGKRSFSAAYPMTMDSVFWVASCTKMITGLVCMQLVEQGRLSLDDAQQVYKLCPEIEQAKFLQHGKLIERKGDITLRMLLPHTAGFGYEFFNKELMDYGRAGGMGTNAVGYEVFAGDEKDILRQPLVNQPGSTWEYGVRSYPSLTIY
jgi:CubicO group peptidase (beta-lactamase class C family)